jgi:hypothetical protein
VTQAHGRSTSPVLRPLGTAELLDTAVRLVRGNVRAVLAVSVPIAVAATLLRALLTLAQVQSSDATFGVLVGGVLTTGWTGTVLTGLLTPVFTAALLGGRTTARAAVPHPARTLGVLLVLGVVIGISETAGLVALVVGGVWLWGSWAVAAPACTAENLGVVAALRRSNHLVRNAFWRTWGVRALGWVVTTVLSLFVSLPLQLLADAVTGNRAFDTTELVDTKLYVAIAAIGSLIAAAVVAPISAAIDVLLYTDLRVRKEGLDIMLGLPAAEPPTANPANPVKPVRAW